MSEGMRIQSQLAADLEVYRAKGELIALRAENARLRKAMQSAYDYMHRPGDDDSAAITFWGKRDLRHVLRKMLAELDVHYAQQQGQP